MEHNADANTVLYCPYRKHTGNPLEFISMAVHHRLSLFIHPPNIFI
jgi:hypothetical protein